MEIRRNIVSAARIVLAVYIAVILFMMFFAFDRSSLDASGGFRYSFAVTGIPLWLPKKFSVLWIFSMGNLLAFVPFGFLLPAAFPKVLRPYWKAGAVFLACIAALECAQMLTHLGSFDIEDILVNFLGFSIGFASWKISLRVPEMWRKACVYIGCVCLFSLVLLIAAEGFNQILR